MVAAAPVWCDGRRNAAIAAATAAAAPARGGQPQAAAPACADVRFVLASAVELAAGEELLVVGNLPALGQWNPAKSVARLQAGSVAYPGKWTKRMQLPLDGGKHGKAVSAVEYKYVRDRSAVGGERFVWEELPANRRLEVGHGPQMQGFTVHDSGFGSAKRELMNWVVDEDLLPPPPPPPPPLAKKSPLPTAPAAAAARLAAAAAPVPGRPVPAPPPTTPVAARRRPEAAPAPRPVPVPVLPPLPPMPTAVAIAVEGKATREREKEEQETTTTTDDAATTCPTEPESNDYEDRGGAASCSSSSVNVPALLGQPGDSMQRVASLSALEQLVEEPEQLLKLRASCESEALPVEERPARYGARHLGTPVVVVTSELHPWSKTGGLAVVASSYAFEFALRGHRTMAVSPMYGDYKNCSRIGAARVWLAGAEHEVQYFHHSQDLGNGKVCDYIFVNHACYRRAEGIYGPPGAEYGDNLFRFALLSLAAAEAPLVLKVRGSTFGDEVLFIANDWQAGLLPVYLYHKYKCNGTYRRARSVVVIHNIGYQGKYKRSDNGVSEFLGLPPEAADDLQGEDMHMGLDCLNLLAGGIRACDRVLTVSPTYASEIQSPEGGHGLYDLLRWKASMLRLAGILNGISDEWNPRTDPHIHTKYGPGDFVEGKRANKRALQRELGLHEDPDAALIGFCGRLCYQKGIPLILNCAKWLIGEQGTGRAQLIIMGRGEPDHNRGVAALENAFKKKVCGYVGFDPCVEHRMMAGCDILLMPSQYEPCGLPQMYAQQYGTLPLVHETGGLRDSVRGLWSDNDAQVATGFVFSGFTEHALRDRLQHALEVYHHRKLIFRRLQENALRTDFYWPRAVDEYERHIDWTMEDPPMR